MELLLPILAGVMVATGVYLILSPAMIRLIIGLSLLSYGVNLAIFLSPGPEAGKPPLLGFQGEYVDPLPQALILTAIVIGFGTTALLLVLSLRAYQASGTDNVQNLLERHTPLATEEPAAIPESPSVSPEAAPSQHDPRSGTTGEDAA